MSPPETPVCPSLRLSGGSSNEIAEVRDAANAGTVVSSSEEFDAPTFVAFDRSDYPTLEVVADRAGTASSAAVASTTMASATLGSAHPNALSQDGEPDSGACRGAAIFDDAPALVPLAGSADPRMVRAPRPQVYPPPRRHEEFHREEPPVQADVSATGNPPVSAVQTHRPRHRASQRREDSGSGDSGAGAGDPDPDADGPWALSFIDRAPFLWRFRALRCRFMEWREGGEVVL